MPDNKPEKKNRNLMQLELLDVTPAKAGQFSAKANKTFWFARAEIPSTGFYGCVYSTIRMTAVANDPFPPHWVPGALVEVEVTDVKTKDGEGSFNVPRS